MGHNMHFGPHGEIFLWGRNIYSLIRSKSRKANAKKRNIKKERKTSKHCINTREQAIERSPKKESKPAKQEKGNRKSKTQSDRKRKNRTKGQQEGRDRKMYAKKLKNKKKKYMN